jgi:hypothetical protein
MMLVWVCGLEEGELYSAPAAFESIALHPALDSSISLASVLVVN